MSWQLRSSKNLYLGLSVLFLVLLCSFTVDAKLADFELAAASEYLNLYFNPETTEIAVEDIQTGNLWFSNPQNRFSTSGYVFNRLSSQFTIVHDPKSVQKDNHRYSIDYEQFEVSPIENGVRVDYTIVEEWKPEHYVPKMIKQQRMEEVILSKIESESDRSRILEYYNLIMLTPLEGERKAIPGVQQERVFGEYDLVILNPDYQERLGELNSMKAEAARLPEGERGELESQIKRLEQQLDKEKEDIVWRLLYTIVDHRLDIEKSDDIVFDHVAHLVDSPTYLMELVPRFYLTAVQKIIIETGYTPLESAEDHLENNIDPILANLQVFSVPIEYTLDGANLVVRIPAAEIEYPIDVENRIGEKFSYHLHTLRVLENFGAADINDEGYIFVPDGSGALIYLNNNRLFTSGYNDQVYDRDHALNTPNEMQRFPETIRLPVFGLKANDQAVFAIIEEGASLARIKADISGRTDNYNRVFAEFSLLPTGSVSISLESENVEFSGSMPVYQARPYQGDFVIRYAFLSGEDANYMGMANYYRSYLIEKHGLKRKAPGESIPFFLELVGAVDKREPILGIARDVIYPLTTFNQAQSVLESLKEEGIKNIQLKYTGWLKGGVEHNYPTKAAVEKALGSADDLIRLVSYAESEGHEVYPSVGFMRVYRDGWFDGFSSRKDSARMLDRLVARTYRYWLDTYDRNPSGSHYVLSPRKLDDLVDRFLQDYQKLGLAKLSLFDLGREVSSDFIDDPNRVIDREQAVETAVKQLIKMKENGLKLMVDHGNAYAIPYADAIVNLPSRGSSYHVVNEEIPFYQIVIHGLIDYAGSPLNLSSAAKADFLRMLESGSYPYFIGSYEPSFTVKGSKFDHLYALHYGDWMEDAAEIYRAVNEALKDVQDQLIVDHRMLAEQVYMTTYENGKQIIVNYNQHPVEVNGLVIDGEDFVVIGGGN